MKKLEFKENLDLDNPDDVDNIKRMLLDNAIMGVKKK